MQGRYLYADFVSDELWSLRLVGNRAVDVTDHRAQLVGAEFAGVTSFAEDARGNLYAVGIDGTVSRLRFGEGAGDGADRHRRRLPATTGCSAAPATTRSWAGAGATGSTAAARTTGWRAGAASTEFVFRPGSGRDRIVDFRDDVDAIRLGGGFGFATPAEALALATEAGGDVVFDFGGASG